MINNSLQLVVKRTLAHWRLLSAVVVGVVLASTIMASSVIFFNALRDVALQRAISTHTSTDIDVLVEAGQIPTNSQTDATIVDAMNSSIVQQFSPFLNRHEFALKTWTFFVDLPPPMMPPSDCPCRTTIGRTGNEDGRLIECDCCRITMMTLPNAKDRVNIIDGRFPKIASINGSNDPLQIEGILDLESAKTMQLDVGDIYPARPYWEDEHKRLDILVTGLYERVEPNAAHWRIQNAAFSSRTNTLQFARFVVPRETILEAVGVYFPNMGSDYSWWLDVDPRRIKATETGSIRNTIESTERELKAIVDGFYLVSDLPQVLRAFETDLFFNRLPMLIVLILIVLVVLYYVVILASLLVDTQKNEIALLKTRGATSRQILAVFIIEASILAVIAASTGPFIAMLGVKFIGVLPIYSELNNGNPLPAGLTFEAFQMAFLGAILGLFALFIPSLRATRLGLLASRVTRTRPARLALIQRYYLDIGFLGLVMFLFWQLTKQGSFVATSLFGETTVNQLILGVPAMFLIAAGFVLIRIYPPGMNVMGKVLSKRPMSSITPPALILGIWQMARNPAHHSRLSLLLILTAALGVFAASFAATLKQSAIDQAYYRTGADLKLTGISTTTGGMSRSVLEAIRKGEDVETVSPIYRETAIISSGINVEKFDLIGLDLETIEDVAWIRDDFGFDSLKSKAFHFNAGSSTGIELPEESRWITARVLPLVRQPSTTFIARLSDSNGHFFSVPLGKLSPIATDKYRFDCPHVIEEDPPKWCRIGSSLQGARFRGIAGLLPAPPIRLHSIGVINFEDGLSPGAIDIDDIAVLNHTGTELLTVETFDSVTNWRIMTPTREALGDNLSPASNPDGTEQKGIARLRWTTSGPREYRGLAHGSELGIVPVIASSQFIEQFGGNDGEIINASVDGFPIKVSVRDVVEYFPTMAINNEPFLIADFNALHERLNVVRILGDRQPKEFWIATTQGSELIDSEDILETVSPGDPAVSDIQQKLASVRVRVGSTISDRTVYLSEVAFDPLVAAGWKALLGIAFLTVLIVSAIGFLVHAKISFNERRNELALLRTIGLSMKQLLLLVVLEQVIVIGIAVAIGIFMGVRMGTTIMPYLASSASNSIVIPPMAIEIDWFGFGITFSLLGLVFFIVISVILISVYRMSIHKVMRMGDG